MIYISISLFLSSIRFSDSTLKSIVYHDDRRELIAHVEGFVTLADYAVIN